MIKRKSLIGVIAFLAMTRVNVGNADASKCIDIPENQSVEVFAGVNLSSLDASAMTAGIGSDDEYLYFTSDVEDKLLNVTTQGGFAYQVGMGSILRIVDDGVGKDAQVLEGEGGCEELAALLQDDNTALAVWMIGTGAALAYAILDDDDPEVVPSVLEPAPTPVGSNNGFCGIPNCSGKQAFCSNQCVINRFELPSCVDCGVSPTF